MTRQRWGQHFLRDAATARRVVAHSEVIAGETVLEIGPGTGRLTRALLEVAARVVAVEIDPQLAEGLPQRAGEADRLTVVQGDAAGLDLGAILDQLLPAGTIARAVASLPYESATTILMRLLDARRRLSGIAVIVQREVAERIVAPPGSRTYGLLSVICQDVTEARLALRLRPGSFRPPPRVDSALVVLQPRDLPRRGNIDGARFRRFVGSLFEQRRKTLGNNLRRITGLDREAVERLARSASVPPSDRPENLSVERFATLLQVLEAAGALPAPAADRI